MNRAVFILSILIATICIPAVSFAIPYQLISGESALIIPNLNFEVKDNFVYTTGYADSWGLRSQLRAGILNWIELSAAATWVYFPDVDGVEDLYGSYYVKQGIDPQQTVDNNPRIASYEGKLKFNITTLPSDINVVGYGKFKYFAGEPVIVRHSQRIDNATVSGVVSSDSPGGKDAFAGGIAKKVFNVMPDIIPLIQGGVEAGYLWDKTWLDNSLTNRFMLVATFAPQVIFYKKVMFQCENRFEYWITRGWHYEVLPGVRWELLPKCILEAGMGFPVTGGKVHRYFFGCTFELGDASMIVR